MRSNQTEQLRLSPRELRLFEVARKKRGWIESSALCAAEFGDAEDWPLNARTIISGAMRAVQRKIAFTRSPIILETRGGGRRGTSYKISVKRE